MAERRTSHLPCPHCGSSDAAQLNPDGSLYCHSCEGLFDSETGEKWQSKKKKAPLVVVAKADKTTKLIAPLNGFTDAFRGISPKTARIYDYQEGRYHGSPAHIANYRDQSGVTVAQHVRFGDKQFRWAGSKDKIQLFGQHLGSSGTLIITEGEIDAMSVYECLQKYKPSKRYVVASLPNGVTSVKKDGKHNLTWMLGFQRRIVFTDFDEPGRKAAAELAALLGPRTAVVGKFAYKDANEAWVAGDHNAILQALDNAKEHRPEAIVHAPDLLARILNPVHQYGLPFPWKGWNDMTQGMKPGQLIMISGGTGIGKSLFTRSIALHLAKAGTNVAYIGLEESCESTLERMLSEQMETPMYLDSEAERKARGVDAIKQAMEGWAQNVFLMEKFGSDEFDNFVANVRHYVLGEECKVVILDHFSLLADGIALNTDQRRAIDRCIKDLKTLAVELNFTMVVVCHLSRSNSMGPSHEAGGEPTLAELRGSHSLAQIPDHVVMLQRNPSHEDAQERNTTHCHLKKNRVKGEVGEMSKLEYIPSRCVFVETPVAY